MSWLWVLLHKFFFMCHFVTCPGGVASGFGRRYGAKLVLNAVTRRFNQRASRRLGNHQQGCRDQQHGGNFRSKSSVSDLGCVAWRDSFDQRRCRAEAGLPDALLDHFRGGDRLTV
jgi:hypothetical protein